MPPRYAYWTILIDGTATAFRAREKDELLPTFQQLKRTNKDVVFKWYARGRLWETPEESQAALHAPKVVPEKRSGGWRPGGTHADPRARFKKKSGARSHDTRPRDEAPRPWSGKPASSSGSRPPAHPWRDKPSGPPRSERPWQNKSSAPPRGERPWQNKSSAPPRGDRPWGTKPASGGSRPPARPWRDKPSGPPRGDRPWRKKKPDPPDRG